MTLRSGPVPVSCPVLVRWASFYETELYDEMERDIALLVGPVILGCRWTRRSGEVRWADGRRTGREEG